MSFFKSVTEYIFSEEGNSSTSSQVETPSKKRGNKDKSKIVTEDQYPPRDLVTLDCASCESECDEHPPYPPYLDIDTDIKLLGSMKPYGRHFLISTAQSDWPKHIEDQEGTLAANLQALVSDHPMPWFTIITNTSHVSSHGGIDVIIQPENILLGNVSPDDAQLVYDLFVKMPLEENSPVKKEDLKHIQVYPNPYQSMILICSHKRRDKRCGVTAPILSREFDHVLRELNISDGEGGTTVMMVSHIGGHKFAGNVICYVNQGKTGIWYGRVKSCHCRAIVEETIVQGKVIKEIYRGSMKYSFGDPDKTTCERLKW